MPFLLPAGTVARLARHPAVSEGAWYIAAKCAACGLPIYILEDAAAGTHQPIFAGPGKFSTPCDRCGHDAEYPSSAAFPIRATESIASRAPVRIEPSGRPRQPVTKRYADARITFGPGFLEDRPQVASLVARCIGVWTEVELAQARLYGTLLRGDAGAPLEQFLKLRSSRAQLGALVNIAEQVLAPSELELFHALMRYRNAVVKARNDLAHGCFGGSNSIPDGIAWISAINLVRHGARVAISGVTPEAYEWLRGRTFVYEPGDLETIARDIEDLHAQLGYFSGYLWSYIEAAPDGPAWRAARLPQLRAHPRIARELRVLRDKALRKSSPDS